VRHAGEPCIDEEPFREVAILRLVMGPEPVLEVVHLDISAESLLDSETLLELLHLGFQRCNPGRCCSVRFRVLKLPHYIAYRLIKQH
jgi:hypothetical protein